MTRIYANVLEQKKVFTEEKRQLPEICLEHQRGRRFIVLKRQYGRGDVMSKCSIPELSYSPSEFNSKIICQHLTN